MKIAIIIISICMAAALIGGFTKMLIVADDNIKEVYIENRAMIKERNQLIKENERLFREQVTLENEMDYLIYGNVEQDSILTHLYNIRHGK